MPRTQLTLVQREDAVHVYWHEQHGYWLHVNAVGRSGFVHSRFVLLEEQGVADGFLRPQNRAMALADTDIDSLLTQMAAYQAEPVSKWLKEEKQL